MADSAKRHRLSNNSILCIILSAIIILVVLRSFKIGRNNNDNTYRLDRSRCFSAEFRRAIERQREGLPLIEFGNKSIKVQETWKSIPVHFNGIWDAEFNKLNVHRVLSDGEETKYFIAFGPNVARPYACNIVTLGVGHVVNAEKNLTTTYPECRFLAADPSADVNADLVRQIGGTFIHGAIGEESAPEQPVIVWDKDMRKKQIAQIGIADFLRNISMDPLDLFMIDVEGAEFGIIEQFAKGALDFRKKLPTTICQLNLELHWPNTLFAGYTYERFFDAFDRWMRSGQFALMHTDVQPTFNFLRMFLVNVEDEVCVQKFLCN